MVNRESRNIIFNNEFDRNTVLTYEEFSKCAYSAFEDHVYDEAEYYTDRKIHQKYIEDQFKNHPKIRYNRYSSLKIDFSNQLSIYLLKNIRRRTIPKIYSLEL